MARDTLEELRESEGRWLSLVTNAPDYILIVDAAGVIRFLNQPREDIPIERAIGSMAEDFVGGPHRAAVRAALEGVFRRGETAVFDVEVGPPGGATRWYSGRFGPVMRDGVVVEASIIATDVTAQKEAEAKLREQTSILTSMLDSTPDGIVVVDEQGRFLVFNRAGERIIGVGRTEGSPSGWAARYGLFLPDMKTPYPAGDLPLARAMRGESVNEVEVFVRNPRVPQGVWLSVNGRPLRDEAGRARGGVCVFRDITAHKQRDESLQRAQLELVKAEKLASIGMLVSGVAHELNNPINVMFGNLRLLEKACEMVTPLAMAGAKLKGVAGMAENLARFKAMIRDAQAASERAKRIIDEFSDFARDTSAAEPTDINRCLEDTLNVLSKDWARRVRIVKRLAPLPSVRCLRGQIVQVFFNLLRNAGEAISKTGTVTLATRAAGDRVVIEIADTGRGMTDDVKRRLFEPFFTTKDVGKGLGVGLAISATIVHNHGGEIRCESKPGRGSTFTIELPLSGAGAPASPPATPEASPRTRARKRKGS